MAQEMNKVRNKEDKTEKRNPESYENRNEKKNEGSISREEFDKVMKESEKYLEKVNVMKESSLIDVRVGMEKLEGLKEKMAELDREISAARKEGKDMFHASALLTMAKGKIGFLEIEDDEERINELGELISQIEKQIKQDKEKKEYDLKSEIMRRVREDNGNKGD